MNALDLAQSWPSLRALSPDAVLASPAWRARVTFEDAPAELVRCDDPTADELLLSVSFDGESHVLGLRDTESTGDLHLLWEKRAGLPDALLIALVERECGGVLQLLENLARAEVKILGLADRVTSSARVGFQLSAGGRPRFSFSLDLPADLVAELGRIENLDATHPSVRALTRPIRAHYATLSLTAEEASCLKAGDFLVLENVAPRWTTEEAKDASTHLVSATEATATFANFADDALPPVPPLASADLVLVRLGKPLFKCSLTHVGTSPAVSLSSL